MTNDSHSYLTTSVSVSAVWQYGTGIFATVCLLGGLIFNGLVIFVFVRNSRLRQPRNFLLISLAVADLGLAVSNNTLHAIASFNKQWPFGQIGCSFYAFTGGLCGLTSIATMAAIALTRLMAVIDPFSSLKLTAQFTFKCIICSWMYGLMWMIPPLFGWSRFIFEGFGTSCTFDYVSKNIWNRLFMLMLVVGGFIIPLTIIIVSYTLILMELAKRNDYLLCKNNKKQVVYPQLNDDFNTYGGSRNVLLFYGQESHTKSLIRSPIYNHRLAQKIFHTEMRATRTALCVCSIYCMAWTPYASMTILVQCGFIHHISVYTTTMLGLFTKTAACINPLIYVLSSPVFRRCLFHRRKSIPYTTTYSERCRL